MGGNGGCTHRIVRKAQPYSRRPEQRRHMFSRCGRDNLEIQEKNAPGVPRDLLDPAITGGPRHLGYLAFSDRHPCLRPAPRAPQHDVHRNIQERWMGRRGMYPQNCAQSSAL